MTDMEIHKLEKKLLHLDMYVDFLGYLIKDIDDTTGRYPFSLANRQAWFSDEAWRLKHKLRQAAEERKYFERIFGAQRF